MYHFIERHHLNNLDNIDLPVKFYDKLFIAPKNDVDTFNFISDAINIQGLSSTYFIYRVCIYDSYSLLLLIMCIM